MQVHYIWIQQLRLVSLHRIARLVLMPTPLIINVLHARQDAPHVQVQQFALFAIPVQVIDYQVVLVLYAELIVRHV